MLASEEIVFLVEEEQINSSVAVVKIQSQTLTKLREMKQQVTARIFSS